MKATPKRNIETNEIKNSCTSCNCNSKAECAPIEINFGKQQDADTIKTDITDSINEESTEKNKNEISNETENETASEEKTTLSCSGKRKGKCKLFKKKLIIIVAVALVVTAGLIIGGYFIVRKILYSPYDRLKAALENTLNAESLHAEAETEIKIENKNAKLKSSVDRVNKEDTNIFVTETETEINNFDIGKYDIGKILDFITKIADKKNHTIIFNNTDSGLYISYYNTDVSKVETVYTDKKLSQATKNADISDIGLVALGILNEQLVKGDGKFTDYVEDKEALQAALKDVFSVKNFGSYCQIDIKDNEYTIKADLYKLFKLAAEKAEPTIKAECMQDFEELKAALEKTKDDNPTLNIILVVEDGYIAKANFTFKMGKYDVAVTSSLSDFGKVDVAIPSAVTASYSKAKKIEQVYKYITEKVLPELSKWKLF